MTNSPQSNTSEQPSSRIPLPGFVGWFFGAAPILLVFGGFLARVNAGREVDWAIFQTMLGTVMFWIGVIVLTAAFILVGVRSIAQRQVDILLRAGRWERIAPTVD